MNGASFFPYNQRIKYTNKKYELNAKTTWQNPNHLFINCRARIRITIIRGIR